MSDLVEFSKHGAIGVITVNNPPVNALSPGVPEGIVDCVEQGVADDGIKAMVLIGAGRSFIAGADIKQLGKKRSERAMIWRDAIEESPKPVVAAIHGFALGGGLEGALACHYRVAVESAKVGLPEVLIGILPGGGGTQRLPRLIGPKAALEMIVTGRHVPAPEAKELGILDEVFPDDSKLLEHAVAFAERIANRRPLPRVRDMEDKLAEAKEDPGMFDAMRKRIARRARNQTAPYHCIKCVEAAVELPFEEGIRRERELFQELVNSDEARALRYAFFAERKVRDIPDIDKDTPRAEVGSVAVIGGGTMGTGIAMACADAGLAVRLLEVDQAALDKAMARIRDTYGVSVRRGSLAEDAVEARMARIAPVLDYDAIADADMVIEAVFERMEVKKPVFEKLDATMKDGAILATNTSGLDIDEIANATGRPEVVIGTHFFSPANVMKLLEIVRGRETAPATVATVLGFARRIAKIGVVCGNCDGFVANRSRVPFNIEMNVLIEEGALPQQIDKVMYEFGYPMGPFAVADLAGGDIGYEGRKRREARNPNMRKLPIADRLVEMGRYGQKTGAGWYRYEKGDRTPHPDPEVEKLIEDYRREAGITPREIGDEEILHRILFSSVNEICKILEEGIAYRASDVDVMWINGFGFPRYRGGVMYWADQIGVADVYEQIREWEGRFGERWAPAKLLKEYAEAGRSFTDEA